MNDDNSKDPNRGHQKIEDIMRERDRLDKILKKKFRKRMTIVFTDVCGYTKYMDTRGDIAGRAWMQKHNDIVLPLIEQHDGTVLMIMGDGVMSSFESTLDAVKACIDIQSGLAEYNKTTEPVDELHVTIGINTGEILVDDDHIAGDTVNVASRIETKADPDQILLSETSYEEVRGSEDIICRKHGSVEVKGKGRPLELYRVVWQDEEIVVSAEPRTRAARGLERKRVWAAQKVMELEVTREDSRLKISAHEHHAGEASTVRQYEEIPVSIENIHNRCNEMVDTLNSCNREGHLSRDVLIKLRELGQVFRNELFTDNVKETFQNAKADHLVINLDDQLVQVPWELLHDGKQFLCQSFNMGRLVKTKQAISGRKSRLLGHPLKMMILADPEGDLKNAREEGDNIRDFLDRRRDLVNVSFRSETIATDYLKDKIRFFDFVHFAGHAVYDKEQPDMSGWRLSDGNIYAKEIISMANSGTMPALIFSNACQSARTEEWVLKSYFQDEIFGLANAFILAGVKHYIGTFWEILDEPGKKFAIEFYRHLLDDKSIGEAVRLARHDLMNEFGEETIGWASYLLYGDPTFNYMRQGIGLDEPQEAEPEAQPEEPALEVKTRAAAQAVEGEDKKLSKKTGFIWAGGIGAAIILALVLWLYPTIFKTDTTEYEKALINYYTSGDFENALTAAETLKEKDADVRLAYLIQGDIYLRNGDLDAASQSYQQALEAKKGSEIQAARSLAGLGRIASLNKQDSQAMDYYQKATDAAPSSSIGYLSQAMLINQKGNAKEALKLLEKANSLSPEDTIIAAVANETRKRVLFDEDEKKQQKIDKLVAELIENMDQPARALPSDGWTSQPLTLWIIDFQTKGYAVQEGEEKLLAAGITNRLLDQGRIQIVERALLDKLLTELKLSTSKLTDRRTALALGKLMAARLMVSGQVVYSGPYTQVTLRMFETESGRITAAENESIPSAAPLSALADKLSARLVEKIGKVYPLRGKIIETSNDGIKLNIGAAEGVMPDQTFSVLNQDVSLRVTSVQPTESFADIIGEDRSVEPGQRVEIQRSEVGGQ
jgi:class 3 adenylate cyclase/CHAT domain-containing protein